jgi:hypothetical protein
MVELLNSGLLSYYGLSSALPSRPGSHDVVAARDEKDVELGSGGRR